MKVGALTSSRADFGIYIPLLNALRNDSFFDLHLIAFGTHLSKKHGYTIQEIQSQGYDNVHEVDTIPNSDSPKAIAKGIAKAVNGFATFWDQHDFDLVFALGDRYEMFAAVSAAIPFGMKIAHIHAGETTLGAIDNGYRHAISLFSKYLFVSTEEYANRAKEIVANEAEVFNVGALSIDNLSKISFLSIEGFNDKFGIDLSKDTILSTFHPETVAFEKNKGYIDELIETFEVLKESYQLVITLPNADTMGEMIREQLIHFGAKYPQVHIVESLGMHGYLSCMKHCCLMVGNTSSAYAEASFFPKAVIDLGDRQKGRLVTANIRRTKIDKEAISAAIREIELGDPVAKLNVYGNGDTAEQIVEILKSWND